MSQTISSITDSFSTLLAGFRQVADGLYGLSVAFLHHATEVGMRLTQDPAVLVVGIILGLAAWSMVSIFRHVANASPAKAPRRGAPKTQNHLQTLAMSEVEKQLSSSP